MNPASPDMGPPAPESMDVTVRGQRLTASIKTSPDDNKIAFEFLREGVPETRFTRQEAKALAKALKEILSSTSGYGRNSRIFY